MTFCTFFRGEGWRSKGNLLLSLVCVGGVRVCVCVCVLC